MNKFLVAILASVPAAAYANNSTVTVDTIESGGYTASYYNNASYTSPEIHVIGIYEAYTNTSPRNHATGTAVVNINGSSNVPVDLVLSAYEPTQWVLQGAGVQYINSVLINGYYSGSVSGIDGSHVIDKTGVGQWLWTYAYAWPSATGGSNTEALVSQVESIYGASISTFSGAYGATQFTVTLSPVPEPTNFALMALGLVSVVGISRSKRHQQRNI